MYGARDLTYDFFFNLISGYFSCKNLLLLPWAKFWKVLNVKLSLFWMFFQKQLIFLHKPVYFFMELWYQQEWHIRKSLVIFQTQLAGGVLLKKLKYIGLYFAWLYSTLFLDWDDKKTKLVPTCFLLSKLFIKKIKFSLQSVTVLNVIMSLINLFCLYCSLRKIVEKSS